MYGRGQAKRGDGRGGWATQFDGKIKASGTDRFCTSCGSIIKGLATTMLAKCQIKICGAKIPMRFGADESEFDSSGWGRCRNCKSFIFRDHIFCQSCRCINQSAKEDRDLMQKQALAKRQHDQEKDKKEKDAKIARLEADYLELSLILSQQNSERNSKQADSVEKGGIIDTHGDFIPKPATQQGPANDNEEQK